MVRCTLHCTTSLTNGPIPKVVKKWAIRMLLWLMKGLVGAKKLLVFLIFSVIRRPAKLLWAGILFPTLTVAYSAYRHVRKAVSAMLAPARDVFRHLLTGRHIVPSVMLTVAVFVSGNSIYANEFAESPDVVIDGGILAETTELHGEEDVVVEEAVEDVEVMNAQDVSYLGTHALSMRDYYPTDEELRSYTGTDDGLYDDTAESHIVNAVRPTPTDEAGTSTGPTRTQIVQYTVEEGDSLGLIAKKFGLATTTILWENNLNSWSVIRPGQTLRILPDDGVSYKVKTNDTVAKIALKYNVPAATIMDTNGIIESAGLKVGEVLVLPGAKPPAPPAPKYVPPATTYVPPPSTEVAAGDAAMIWPAGVRRITQYYGPRHTGLDIAGPMRTPIYAAADGTVTFSGWNSGGYGNMIIVDHGNGLFTRYAHNTRNLMNVGDAVKQGDVIALMGSTGRSTGPHLHFEVMSGGIYSRVNPLKYVK
jgi:murein DD-endopeptidase MepM/ murein hydrolase activator NlpD